MPPSMKLSRHIHPNTTRISGSYHSAKQNKLLAAAVDLRVSACCSSKVDLS